nr:probable ADP-ribosylation factor GTPase-activating protein AGD14 isoform X1 [Tanacetum cinerariifolium]
RTASSSSLASSNGNPTELRRESSLIDFDADPEPPSTAPVQQTQQIAPSPAPAPFAAQPTVPSNDNWASFDSSPVVKASQPPSSGNLLDMLSELSVPASGNVQPAANVQVPPFGTAAPAVTPGPAFNPGGAPFDAFGSFGGGQWQNVHAQQNIHPATGIQPPTSSFNQAAGGYLNNQPSSAPSGNSQITSSIEAKPKELPVDLFTSSYSPYAAQGPGWYPAPQYGMGYNMQYNVPQQPMPSGFVQPSKSSNPFDVNDSPAAQPTMFNTRVANSVKDVFVYWASRSDAHQSVEKYKCLDWVSSIFDNLIIKHSTIIFFFSMDNIECDLSGEVIQLRSMTSFIASCPLRSTSLISHTCSTSNSYKTFENKSMGNPAPSWMPQQASHPLAMPPQGPYGSAMPSGPFMGQVPPNIPSQPRPQVGNFGYDMTSFGAMTNQQQGGLYATPPAVVHLALRTIWTFMARAFMPRP